MRPGDVHLGEVHGHDEVLRLASEALARICPDVPATKLCPRTEAITADGCSRPIRFTEAT